MPSLARLRPLPTQSSEMKSPRPASTGTWAKSSAIVSVLVLLEVLARAARMVVPLRLDCKKNPSRKGGDLWMKAIKVPPAPAGMKWIFRRFRKVRNSTKVLDAWAYGYQAWPILVRA